MDRGNSKHGPKLDDQMAHEVQGLIQGGSESRVDERHDPEPRGEDQRAGTGPLTSREPGAPPGMTYQEVEQRSRLGRFIPKSRLPGDRDQLIVGARELNAPDDIIVTLAGLPAEERYATVNEVWAALGHHNESRRT